MKSQAGAPGWGAPQGDIALAELAPTAQRILDAARRVLERDGHFDRHRDAHRILERNGHGERNCDRLR